MPNCEPVPVVIAGADFEIGVLTNVAEEGTP
jgi:hypothetical protein